MSLPAMVLYEDSLVGHVPNKFPLHLLLMRLVEDDINGETWRLLGAVKGNPRNGVGGVVSELKRRTLYDEVERLLVLVDRDRIAQQLGLPKTATDGDVSDALNALSPARAQLVVYFLRPSMEGLLKDLQRCAPDLEPDAMRRALQKKLNDRDIVLNEARKAARRALRDCLRGHQPGLDALAKDLAALLTAAPGASPP